MRFQGRISEWRDEGGFGFITPNGGGERVFVHIKSLPQASRRPAQDDRVNYRLERDERGRLRAANVEYVARRKTPSTGRRTTPALLVLPAVFLGLPWVLAWLGKLHLIIAMVYAAASGITFIAYAMDKAAAKADRWRTPESTLLLLGLLGGWPGGLIAQQLLRHKTKKASFVTLFWISVAANVAALLWLMTSTGKSFLHGLTPG